VSGFGTIEQDPNQEGRNMTMVLAPVKASANSRKPERPAEAVPAAEAAAPEPAAPELAAPEPSSTPSETPAPAEERSTEQR
jgi:hypothetical protein